MNKAFYGKGRLKVGERNKTEARYEAWLEVQKRAGNILRYDFEAVTLKLADNTRYTPDFMVMKPDGEIEFHEVKFLSRLCGGELNHVVGGGVSVFLSRLCGGEQ